MVHCPPRLSLQAGRVSGHGLTASLPPGRGAVFVSTDMHEPMTRILIFTTLLIGVAGAIAVWNLMALLGPSGAEG